jgi:hypothetical protein
MTFNIIKNQTVYKLVDRLFLIKAQIKRRRAFPVQKNPHSSNHPFYPALVRHRFFCFLICGSSGKIKEIISYAVLSFIRGFRDTRFGGYERRNY